MQMGGAKNGNTNLQKIQQNETILPPSSDASLELPKTGDKTFIIYSGLLQRQHQVLFTLRSRCVMAI